MLSVQWHVLYYSILAHLEANVGSQPDWWDKILFDLEEENRGIWVSGQKLCKEVGSPLFVNCLLSMLLILVLIYSYLSSSRNPDNDQSFSYMTYNTVLDFIMHVVAQKTSRLTT